MNHESDGWHATFSDSAYTCTELDGQTMTGVLESTWVLRFTVHGTIAEAHERNVYAPGSGSGTDSVDWTAKLSKTLWQPAAPASA